MPPRFYFDQPITGDSLTIAGDEVKHIVGAHRLGVGDDIVLFDGSGDEFLSRIRETEKKSVLVSVIERRSVSRELPFELVLAVALPKGDRQKVLVEKLVELGVTRLIPVNCQRSVVVASRKSVQRLDRRVIEASKQCGRNRLMEISSPKSFDDIVVSTAGQKFIAHRLQGPCGHRPIDDRSENASVTVAVGPEGGFTDDEISAAGQSGWQIVSFGPTILRVETAAVCAATCFGIGRLPASTG